MKITYLSHSCFHIETSTHKLIIDPFLTGNPLAQTAPADVEADFVLVTHGHNDHVGDALEIARNNNATVIANFEVASFLMAQGAGARPMHIGGAAEFPFGRVKLTIAHHGSGYQTEDGQMVYMGAPAGMLIFADGKALYHAGDTALTYDMRLLSEECSIDVAMLPIGDNFTMGIDDAARAVEFLRPKIAVPMHYNTFDLIEVDPRAFAAKASADVKVLAVGESFEV
jgi:L-ascorbate metabolism protein UlaG (beta-lactamase superfamily)